MTTMAHAPGAGVAAPSAGVGPLTAIRHAVTLAWRSLVQIKHNPLELLDLSLQPLLFVLLFAYIFGGALSGSPKEFLQFGLAGIIVQNALFLTMNTAVALNTDITKGVFDRFRSLPIARSAPLAGRIAADVVRQAWSVGILLGVGSILGFRVHTGLASAVGAIALLIGFTLAFSWLPVLIGMLVSEPEKVQVFGFTVLFPLTFASSAFVPTSTMPGWMQAWVKVNPVTLLTDSLRGLLVSGPVARPLFGALAWAVGIMLVFAPLTSVASPRTRTLQPVQVASSTPSTSNATRAPRLATSSLVPSSVRNSTVCWSKTKLTGSAIGPRSSTSTRRPRCCPASSRKHSSLVSSCQRTSCTSPHLFERDVRRWSLLHRPDVCSLHRSDRDRDQGPARSRPSGHSARHQSWEVNQRPASQRTRLSGGSMVLRPESRSTLLGAAGRRHTRLRPAGLVDLARRSCHG